MSNLSNFRDLGGLIGEGGRKVRLNKLLRAAQIVSLMQEDIDKLMSYGLKAIVDFRSLAEVEKSPDDEIKGAKHLHLDIMADSFVKFDDYNAWTQTLKMDTAERDMIRTYKEFVTMDSAKKGYACFIRECINAAEGGVLFHCAAGKDRTGFGAAIILKILGVSDEDIFQDYYKTLEERRGVNERLYEEYRAKGLNDEQIEAIRVFYGVKKEYLEAAFSEVEKEFGSFENYIKNGLGINAEEIDLLKELYLED